MAITTADIGFAIRDLLEGNVVCHVDQDKGQMLSETTIQVVSIDISDPDNPILYLENGAQFRIRIFRLA